MKPDFMKQLYAEHVTPELRKRVESMTDEERGIIIVNQQN